MRRVLSVSVQTGCDTTRSCPSMVKRCHLRHPRANELAQFVRAADFGLPEPLIVATPLYMLVDRRKVFSGSIGCWHGSTGAGIRMTLSCTGCRMREADIASHPFSSTSSTLKRTSTSSAVRTHHSKSYVVRPYVAQRSLPPVSSHGCPDLEALPRHRAVGSGLRLLRHSVAC